MKFRGILALIAFGGLTVSCAHKPTLHDTEVVENHSEAPIENKAGTINKKEIAFTCDVQGDKRTVILDKKEKRCEVHYEKNGSIKQVAWAENTPSICDRAFNSIRSNIEGSGFKCIDGTKTSEKLQEKKKIETAATMKK